MLLMFTEYTLGATLLRRLKNAVPERGEQVFNFLKFTESLLADTVLEWTEMVEKWERDNKEVNPFVIIMPSKWCGSACQYMQN